MTFLQRLAGKLADALHTEDTEPDPREATTDDEPETPDDDEPNAENVYPMW